MRENKYRGMSRGQWIYGDLILCGGRAWIRDINDKVNLRLVCSSYADWRCVEVGVDTVGQYTGLHDKNGKKIYEGDVIKFSNHVDEVYEEVGVVDFDLSECGYKATYKTREYNDVMGHYVRTNCIYLINNKEYECDYEVIGNIYENPDLLKEDNHAV